MSSSEAGDAAAGRPGAGTAGPGPPAVGGGQAAEITEVERSGQCGGAGLALVCFGHRSPTGPRIRATASRSSVTAGDEPGSPVGAAVGRLDDETGAADGEEGSPAVGCLSNWAACCLRSRRVAAAAAWRAAAGVCPIAAGVPAAAGVNEGVASWMGGGLAAGVEQPQPHSSGLAPQLPLGAGGGATLPVGAGGMAQAPVGSGTVPRRR